MKAGGSPAPTREQYLRILALRVLRGEDLDSTLPGDEIAEAKALAAGAGLLALKSGAPKAKIHRSKGPKHEG